MVDYRVDGDRFGRHRVLEPKGVLPQGATRLDNSLPIFDNEILIDVRILNIDSASFRQMREAAGGDPEKIADQVLKNVSLMGKQQNLVTGSGGMLLGKVLEMGPKYSNPAKVKKGDAICSLVSLTLTPLIIAKVRGVRDSEQIDIDGKAIFFDSGVLAKIPGDIDLKVCLALLDVAGAPAQAARLTKKGDTIYIIGAGKSAILSAAAIRDTIGKQAKIIVSATRDSSVQMFKSLGLADICFVADALKPAEMMKKVEEITNGRMCDLVINTANVEGTELSSVLACRAGGRVYFFNMATSFQKAALGAEGVGMDVEMIIGNGYAPGHAEYTLDLYRKTPAVKKWFNEKFSGSATN